MLKRNLITVLPAVVMLTLSGCGNGSSEITGLKEQSFPIGSSLTFEQALENRKACASTSWDFKKDDQGREIIQYECGLKGIDELNDPVRAQSDDPVLISSATHSIEWLHSEGEYSHSNSGFSLYMSSGENVHENLEKYESYYLVVDPEVTELSTFVKYMEEYTEWRR
ncbi:hypothetical protein [Halomonas sp. HAL1]|uniref:hypothetical protein n=1 Tax=Halomonas sp. HAL1 TaxID=550984 RepID=UPI00022D2764|nr:hypothetical protein [Halomonas sp. HAL1]EHA15262.1 hypothetical protein HAL1_12124 [Halomonas sp. HAL1]WKV95074.1 hypothetical protein Q3Y66_20495 [Halomonas sp. HAL1]